MTVRPLPYDIVRAIQDQQRATDRLVNMLIGMLDASAPDPFLSADVASIEGAVRAIPMPAGSRRVTEERARPPVMMTIDGIEVKTTKRRAKLLGSVMDAPMTLTDMTRAGIAPSVAGVKAQIIDTNRDLERAGVARRVRMQALPAQRRGARGGRLPALYALLGPKNEIASPNLSTASQDEGAAGASPEEAASVSAVGEGDVIDTAQGAEFVTSTGGEVATVATESLPAADVSEIESRERPAAVGAAAVIDERPPQPIMPKAVAAIAIPKPSAKLKIEPGDLIAVDVKFRRIQTSKGVYEVAGASLARALDKLRGGQMFGLDVVAKVAGWPTAEVARTALNFARKRLSDHGLDLYLDKINVRLRSAA